MDTLPQWLDRCTAVKDPPVLCATWPKPEGVELTSPDGVPAITYRRLAFIGRSAPRADARGILRRFLRLVGASDERVRAFVERYGPLYLCRHELPDGHFWPQAPTGRLCYVPDREYLRAQARARGRPEESAVPDAAYFRDHPPAEPTEWYRRYARLLGVALRTFVTYRQAGQASSPEDPAPQFFVDDVRTIDEFWERHVAAQEAFAAQYVEGHPGAQPHYLTPM